MIIYAVTVSTTVSCELSQLAVIYGRSRRNFFLQDSHVDKYCALTLTLTLVVHLYHMTKSTQSSFLK